MSEIPEINRSGPLEWHLALPDWGELDTVWERRIPFVLWQIGEQSLLAHWLDAAVDQGTEKVTLYAADRPNDVRKAVEVATLWPLKIEVITVASIANCKVDDCVNRLPRTAAMDSPPTAGWGLIRYWYDLEQTWLKTFAEETKNYGLYAAVGRSCEIATDVHFKAPFWIGSHVSIGPGVTIGPGAVIEDGCILAGNSRVERAHLAAHTFLGPETDLVESILHKNNLLNLKHQAYVRGLEGFLAGGLQDTSIIESSPRPSCWDRLRAARLYWRWRKHSSSADTFTGIDGQQWPKLDDFSIQSRGAWLRLVALGKMPLFGVTPRDASSIEDLPTEWQSILRKAPVGAFSYADVMGVLDPSDMEGALHCIYQVTGDPEHCRDLCYSWLFELLDA